MTIKQHGGVFGRNPSFNAVEAQSLSIAGNAVPDASTILVDGDIGSTVQGYDADTAKLDVTQTFSAQQTFSLDIVMANGKGIDFSATSDNAGVDSEIFHDYEEGTYTPRLRENGPGEASFYSSHNELGYTKVGKMVHVYGRLIVETETFSGSGAYLYLSLPFTPSGQEMNTNIYVYGANSDNGNQFVLWLIASGSDSARIVDPTTSGLTYATPTEVITDMNLTFSFAYEASA